jgi:hypothetical protein
VCVVAVGGGLWIRMEDFFSLPSISGKACVGLLGFGLG